MLAELLKLIDDALVLEGRGLTLTVASPLAGAIPELDSMGVMAIVNDAGDPVDSTTNRLGESTDLTTDLTDHARRQLTAVLQPRPMQLRRLVIAEATSFPALGRAFYELGPGRTITELASAFTQLGHRGLLRLNDPTHAASDFNWLVMSEPLNRAMLLGESEPPPETSIGHTARRAVNTFLAAYGNATHQH